MARYSLRNQDKIESYYDKSVLDRIIKSLDSHFKETKEIKQYRSSGDKYDTIIIDDIGHTVNMIAFYVISKTYDVYNLAFKEFIG